MQNQTLIKQQRRILKHEFQFQFDGNESRRVNYRYELTSKLLLFSKIDQQQTLSISTADRRKESQKERESRRKGVEERKWERGSGRAGVRAISRRILTIKPNKTADQRVGRARRRVSAVPGAGSKSYKQTKKRCDRVQCVASATRGYNTQSSCRRSALSCCPTFGFGLVFVLTSALNRHWLRGVLLYCSFYWPTSLPASVTRVFEVPVEPQVLRK